MTRLSAVLISVLLLACGERKASDAGTATAPQASPEAEAGNTAAEMVTSLAETPQLATEVEIKADGMRPIRSEVIRGPRPANSAQADLVIDAPSAAGEFSYTIADPRIAEIEGQETRVLPSARTFIYTPLDFSAKRVTVRQVAGARGEAADGGVMDLEPLMVEACRRDATAAPAACQQLLGQAEAKQP